MNFPPMRYSIRDEFCIQNGGFCIQTDGFCIHTGGFCIQNSGFCFKNDGFVFITDEFRKMPRISALGRLDLAVCIMQKALYQVLNNDELSNKTRNFVSKTKNCVLNTRNCVIKLMNLAAALTE